MAIFDDRKDLLPKFYVIITNLLAASKFQLSTITQRRISLISEVETYEELINRIKDYICPVCQGLKKIRNFTTQDESRVETCRACGGTGLK